MNIDLLKAIQVINKKLVELSDDIGMDLKIIEDAIIEKEYYWVFFYNSKLYLDNGNLSYALAGNSPFIVDKIQGKIYETGTAYDIKFYMEEFEKNEIPVLLGSASN